MIKRNQSFNACRPSLLGKRTSSGEAISQALPVNTLVNWAVIGHIVQSETPFTCIFPDVEFKHGIVQTGKLVSGQWDKLVITYTPKAAAASCWEVEVWEDKRFLTWVSDTQGGDQYQSGTRKKITSHYVDKKLNEASSFMLDLNRSMLNTDAFTYRSFTHQKSIPDWVVNQMKKLKWIRFRFRLAMPASEEFKLNMDQLSLTINRHIVDNSRCGYLPGIHEVSWSDDCGLTADETLHHNLKFTVLMDAVKYFHPSVLAQQSSFILKKLKENVRVGSLMQCAEIEWCLTEKKVILHTRLNSDNTEKMRAVKQAFIEAARYLTILSVPAFRLQCQNVNQVSAVASFLRVARSRKRRYYIEQVGYLRLMDSAIDEANQITTFTVSGSELNNWNSLDEGGIGRLKTKIKSILNRCRDNLPPLSLRIEKVLALPACYIEQDWRPFTHKELQYLRGRAKSNGPLFGLPSSKTQMVVDWNFMMLLLLRLKGQGKVAQDSVDQCHALYQSVISTQPRESRVAALGVLTACFRGVLNDSTINLQYKRQALQVNIPSSLFVKGFNHNQCVDCQYVQFDSSVTMGA